jgi:hypothetical protein
MPDKRAKVNWLAVRTAYVVKGYTAQKCATEFGVDVTTIRKKASSEGWTAERHANTMQGENVAVDGASEVVAAANAERVQSDRAFSEWLQSLVEGGKEQLAKITDPAENILARNRLVAAGHRIVTMKRTVQGVVPGQPSDFVLADDLPEDEIDNTITISTRRLEPVKIITDENGRALTHESA